ICVLSLHDALPIFLWEEGQHTESLILNADLVMKSPGIPDSATLINKISEKGIPIVSEIEFASWFDDAINIAITGSNGKTTTTTLTYYVLEKGGVNVAIGGNIGKSHASQLIHPTVDAYVLELSSFQLDGIEKYKPHIAVITNISPDHL